jgi:hypothetical protein
MQAGVVAAACTVLPLKSALGQGTSNGSPGNPRQQEPLSAKLSREQLGYYTQSSFAPYLNTQFSVYLDTTDTRRLKLVEVSDYLATLPKSAVRGVNPHKLECFSLLLTIPPGRSFEQDTYLLEHEALGTFYLFMVPIGQRGKTALDYYEAIVYRHPGSPGSTDSALSNDIRMGNAQVPQGNTAEGATTEILTNGQNLKTEKEVFYFRPQAIEPPAPAQVVIPGAAGRRAASQMTVAQSPALRGLRLGMTIEQVLALFPGIKNDAEISASLSRPASPLGVQSFVINPGKYSTERFNGVSQIAFTLLDGRVSTLSISYDGPVWEHVDGFVARVSGETKLPGADSWDSYAGMDSQLKTLKCKDFEVSVFAGGNNLNVNYVQISDMTAQQKIKERRARAKR